MMFTGDDEKDSEIQQPIIPSKLAVGVLMHMKDQWVVDGKLTALVKSAPVKVLVEVLKEKFPEVTVELPKEWLLKLLISEL